MAKKITLSHIAELTGFSLATISRTINGKGNVTEETKKKIFDAIKSAEDEYENTENFLNRNSHSLILVIGDESTPTFGIFLTGVKASAKKHNYHVLELNFSLSSSDMKNELKYITEQLPLAGIILQNSVPTVTSKLFDDISSRFPTVVCFEHIGNKKISSIAIDNFNAAKTATEYLIAIGRMNIALLNAPLVHTFARKRQGGYLEALKEAGFQVNPEHIASLTDFNFSLAYNAALQLLEANPRPDAIFAVTDTFAAATINAATHLGLTVPGDVAVVGFDNTEISIITNPQITTVSQPIFDIGFQGCNLLIEMIHAPGQEGKKITLLPELIVRSSTQ